MGHCCPNQQIQPIATAPCVMGKSTGMILVLYILLVIIVCAFPIFC